MPPDQAIEKYNFLPGNSVHSGLSGAGSSTIRGKKFFGGWDFKLISRTRKNRRVEL